MTRMTPRALLVDLDGTLLGSHDLKLRYQFTTRMLSALRGSSSRLRTLRTLQHTIRAITEEPAGTPARTNWERGAAAFATATGEEREAAIARMTRAVEDVFPRLEGCFFPIPGAKDFLSWARDHYRLYLATNPVWSEGIVRLRLKWAGIDPAWFASITHAQRMHSCKPALSYYTELLAQESLEPSHCLMIGDDAKKDLPASFVGIPTYLLGRNGEPRELRPEGAQAPVWRGSYAGLKSLLATARNEGAS